MVRSRRLRVARALATVAVVATATAVSLASASSSQEGDVDWTTVNGTLDGQRYSPLAQINRTVTA